MRNQELLRDCPLSIGSHIELCLFVEIDASPDTKYGYEDAAPDSNFVDEYSAPLSSSQDFSVPRPSDGHRPSRRSSLKQPGSSPRRRASMGIEYEIHVLGRRQPVRRRSSITFDEKVQVKPVIPLKDLAGDEAEKLWFQDDEFTQMREKSWKIVEEELEARSGGSGRGTRYCTRGLEQMINSEQAIQQTKAYVASVLSEQDMQRRTCTYDQEYMAKLAQFVTLASQEEAQLRAKTDEQEMERINRRALRRKSTMM